MEADTKSDALDLSGEWSSSEYQCPVGVDHDELIRITQRGTAIEARKIVGDNCVPTGHVTFAGALPRSRVFEDDLPLSIPVDVFGGVENQPDTIGSSAASARILSLDELVISFPEGSLRFVRED